MLLTESMSRPSDPLASVLPAVYGCFNASGSSSRVGWYVPRGNLAHYEARTVQWSTTNEPRPPSQVRLGAHAWR